MSGHPRFKELTERELKLHEEKNTDYAKGGDPLGNFKRVSAILALYPGLSLAHPTVVAMVYMLKQLDAALWMLAQGYEGKVEDVDSRLTDVHVYAKLARIIRQEEMAPPGSDGGVACAFPPPRVEGWAKALCNPQRVRAYHQDLDQDAGVSQGAPEEIPF